MLRVKGETLFLNSLACNLKPSCKEVLLLPPSGQTWQRLSEKRSRISIPCFIWSWKIILSSINNHQQFIRWVNETVLTLNMFFAYEQPTSIDSRSLKKNQKIYSHVYTIHVKLYYFYIYFMHILHTLHYITYILYYKHIYTFWKWNLMCFKLARSGCGINKTKVLFN